MAAVWMILALGLALFSGCTEGNFPQTVSGSLAQDDMDPEQGDPEPVKMMVVLPLSPFSFVEESALHAAAELEAQAQQGRLEYKLEQRTGVDGQLLALEEAAEWRADVVVLWPLQAEGYTEAARALMEAGAALVLYDEVLAGVEATAVLTGDNEQIGRWGAEYLLDFYEDSLREGATVGMLYFGGGNSAISRARAKGREETLAASAHADAFVMLADTVQTEWETETAYTETGAWLNAAAPEELDALRVVLADDDVLVDGVVQAVREYEAENPGRLRIDLICGAGGRRETLALFEDEDGARLPGPQLLTYYYSPAFIRQAILLGLAAAQGVQYEGQDVLGQTFLLPTIEIDRRMVSAYRASEEFALRYSV